MLQSTGSGRACSLLCWLNYLSADVASVLFKMNFMIPENAVKICDYLIRRCCHSVSHSFGKITSLSADCLSAFETLANSNNMIFSDFPFHCALSAAARPHQ